MFLRTHFVRKSEASDITTLLTTQPDCHLPAIITFIRSHRRRRRLSDRVALVCRPLSRLELTKPTRRHPKRYAAPCLELHQKDSPRYRHSAPRVGHVPTRQGQGVQCPRSQPICKNCRGYSS